MYNRRPNHMNWIFVMIQFLFFPLNFTGQEQVLGMGSFCCVSTLTVAEDELRDLGKSRKCSLIQFHPALQLSCSTSCSQRRPANYATLLSGPDNSHLLSKHNQTNRSLLSFCFYCLLESNQLIFATVENIIWAIKHDFNGCYL